MPFSVTPNAGGVYKVWLLPASDATVSEADLRVLIFTPSSARTTIFKARPSEPPLSGSCQPASSLSALVRGTNVVSYIPKGSWNAAFSTGVSVVNVEGSSVTPTLVSTPSAVNSCASNPITGVTVCTANNTDVYVLSGTSLTHILHSSGSARYLGQLCTNCTVTMDAIPNRAAISLMLGPDTTGFQFLNLDTLTFEPAFASHAPVEPSLVSENMSAAPLIDPATPVSPPGFEPDGGWFANWAALRYGVLLGSAGLLPAASSSPSA